MMAFNLIVFLVVGAVKRGGRYMNFTGFTFPVVTRV